MGSWLPAVPRKGQLAVSLAVLAVCALIGGTAFAQPKGPKETKEKEKVEEAGGKDTREQKELSLAVGESKTLIAPDVKEYSEGPGGVADIRVAPDGKKFIVVGVASGTTSLLLIKNDGTQLNWIINVFSQAPEIVENELKQLLRGYTGVKVKRIGSRLFIEGGVNSEEESAKIQKVADLYTGQVQSLVTVGSGSVQRGINVRIDFFFVQYNKNAGYQFGIAFPEQIGGPNIQSTFAYDFIEGSATTAQAAVVNQPLPGLDIAANNGWAKVIKQSTLITNNGNKALFNSGGEVNIPVTTGFESKVEQIKFGTDVTVLPRFDPESNVLEVEVQADVADLVPPQSTATPLPGRNISKLATTINLKLGQSLVLSGIRAKGQRHQINGLPLLSEIPVLGVFFGTHQNVEEEVEGAVFIIPSIVESVPKSSYDAIKSALRQYDDYDGNIDDMNSFSKEPPNYGAE